MTLRRVNAMRKFIPPTLTVFLLANPAVAEDGKECFSPMTKFNVCEKAREMQGELAASLPMKMNANITLSMASVAGPRIAVIAIWHKQKAEVDALLQQGGMSLSDLDARMAQATRNVVCTQAAMAAFIRLGGQVQYLYRTEDAITVMSPVISAC